MTKNYDSGRSMVEMLGTLAIIGVLSVGAIVGYSYAMDKYRANRTMNDVRLRGMDVLAQFDTTGSATLDGWKDEPTLYPISLEEGTIGIQVDNVPQRVCEMIAEGMEHSADIKFIISTEASADCGDKTTMVFYFDDDPTEGEGNINKPVREQCGETLCEQCEVCDKDTMTCVSVDSSESLLTGLGGIKCIVDGQNGYCLQGVCEPLHSSCEVEGAALCIQDGQEGICVNEQCFALCSNPKGPCDAFGAKGACMLITFCVPLTDDGCHASLLGKTEQLSDEWAFACERDGVEGVCIGGVCVDSVCVGKEDEEACEVNGQTGMCLYGVCMASCSNNMGSCDAFGKAGVCADGLCAPLTDDGCSATFAGQTIPLPNELSFACEKDGKDGTCVGGVCTLP